MLANIRKGKKEGLYRKELDEVIITKLHLLRIENLQDSGLFKEDEILSARLFREVFIYHIHGMATREGIRVLENNMDRINMLENQMTV